MLPQVPFEDFVIHLRGGARAPLANPLACGPASPERGDPALHRRERHRGRRERLLGERVRRRRCRSRWDRRCVPENPRAGAFSPFTFGLSRADAQQYLSRVTVTLPPGLVGAIPTVPLCGDAQANAGTCPAASQIGTVAVAAGAGGEPYAFAGQVYLTGPYAGAPYGLSVVVPAVAGPYDLGEVVTRAAISVGLYNGRDHRRQHAARASSAGCRCA